MYVTNSFDHELCTYVVSTCSCTFNHVAYLQGSNASWKVLFFPLKFPGPGKSWKMSLSWKVLEI